MSQSSLQHTKHPVFHIKVNLSSTLVSKDVGKKIFYCTELT